MQGRDSKSRRGPVGSLLSCLWGNSGAEGQSACLLLMVAIGLVLNIAVCAIILTGAFSPAHTIPAVGSHTELNLATVGSSGAEPQLRSDLATWQASHRTVTGQFEALKQQYTELSTAHQEVRKMLVQAQAAVAAPAAPAESGSSAADQARISELETALSSARKEVQSKQSELENVQAKLSAGSAATGSCPPCQGGQDHSRLQPSDLTLQKFDLSSHDIVLECDPKATLNANETIVWCEENARNEQYYQLQFFDRPGAGSRAAIRKPKPAFPNCVQLPPVDYTFPSKVQSMPLAVGSKAVHWPNLRVQKLEDLLVFNMGTPKNLYHFNASFYDYEQEGILDVAAKHIPFGHKVRLMLDVGAGGASLGLLAKRRYDVQSISTVFADWPYCEYITERGNLCMYVDAMEAMPFAKFSYDVVHSSWVFHALFTHQLRTAYLEQHRILRPGGYMWIYGGWSFEQVETIRHLLVDQLGYKMLYEHRAIVDTKVVKHAFDTIPFELEWTVILLKPVRADDKTCVRVQPAPEK